MKRSTTEFRVLGLTPIDGRLIVDGRCLDAPISVGDVFKVVYQLFPDRPLNTPGAVHTAIEPRDASLRVEEIYYFRKSIEVIHPGYTARLVLSGTGGERIREMDVLGVEVMPDDD